MPRRKFRSPDFMVRAAGVRIFPRVRNIQRVTDYARANLVAEQALQHVFIYWQRVLRKDRIAEFLEFLHDLVIETGIVMVRAAKHDNTDAIVALKLVEYLTGPAADTAFVVLQRLITGFHRAVVFFLRESENRLPSLQHLVGEQLAVGEVQHRIEIFT